MQLNEATPVAPQPQLQVAAPPPKMSLQDQKNLQAFAKQAKLIAGTTVNHEAANN